MAAFISRSTSASVGCSRVRSLAFGRRIGLTVRFTLRGCDDLEARFCHGKCPLCDDDCPKMKLLRTATFLWGYVRKSSAGFVPREELPRVPTHPRGLPVAQEQGGHACGKRTVTTVTYKSVTAV